MAAPPPTIRSKQPVASWTAVGKAAVHFSFTHLSYSGGNRVVDRERTYQDGMKGDDTGGQPDTFQVTVMWLNGNTEPGIDNPASQYPDEILRLVDACRVHQVGDLVLPTWGKIRARAIHWNVDENVDRVDMASGVIVFKRDNESSGAQTFAGPSAKSAVAPIAAQLAMSMQADGIWSQDAQDMTGLAGDLEGYASNPADNMGDILGTAQQLLGAVVRIQQSFANPVAAFGIEAAGLLLLPRASYTERLLIYFADLASTIILNLPGFTGPRPVRFQQEVSLLDVVVLSGASLEDLITLNPNLLEYPEGIPPLTVILVPDSELVILGAVN